MENIAKLIIEWLKESGINPIAFLCLAVGIFLILAGIVGRYWKGEDAKLDDAAKRKFVLMGLVLAIAGFLLYLVTKFWEATRTISLHNVVDILLLVVAIASCVFAYSMRHSLKNLQETTEKLVKAVTDTAKSSSDEIVKQVGAAEEKLVRHVEDATRHLLIGLPSIFDRALQLVDGAERELWYVGFVVNFGYPHQFRKEVCDEYERLSPRYGSIKTFVDAVDHFRKRLSTQAHVVPEVRILTIDDTNLTKGFLAPMGSRARYDHGRILEIAEQCKVARARLLNSIEGRDDSAEAKGNGVHLDMLREATTLPIQLIIAGLPKKEGEARERVGCLVFMVGTEVLLGAESANFREAGFYSELEDVADVYRQMAKALSAQAKPVRPAQANAV
jgi:hypothetical protein